MFLGMESRGQIKPGDNIVEATSGNTGIATAMIGKSKGYNVTIIMPDTMSLERRALIKAYGAELILTPGAQGMQGSIDKMNELLATGNYKALGQFDNKDNRSESTRLNSSHANISYAVFCLKKKKKNK